MFAKIVLFIVGFLLLFLVVNQIGSLFSQVNESVRLFFGLYMQLFRIKLLLTLFPIVLLGFIFLHLFPNTELPSLLDIMPAMESDNAELVAPLPEEKIEVAEEVFIRDGIEYTRLKRASNYSRFRDNHLEIVRMEGIEYYLIPVKSASNNTQLKKQKLSPEQQELNDARRAFYK